MTKKSIAVVGVVVILAGAALTLVGRGRVFRSATPAPSATSSPVAYEYSTPLFSLEYPTGWQAAILQGREAAFIAPKVHGFAASVIVATSTVSASTTAQIEAMQVEAVQQRMYSQFAVTDEGVVPLNGNAAYVRQYTWVATSSVSAATTSRGIGQVQVFAKKGNVLFVLTATSLMNDFAGYQPVFTAIIRTFTLK